MAELIDKLIRENVQQLQPYQSARRLFSGGQYWLNANESPFSNDFEVNSQRFNRYPDCQPAALLKHYAAYAGVDTDQVIVSRGADEGIELLIRTFCCPERDSILICPPTYGMYAISAQSSDVRVEYAPLKADFSLDLPAIKTFAKKVKLVFLCSPNNPTGTRISAQQIEHVLLQFADSALVVVDEAYIEFCPSDNWAARLAEYPNLVILRTLSKGFALAGIRCGFTLAHPRIIEALLKTIAPYPIPDPVAQIALQALSKAGVKRMQQQVQAINQQKQSLKRTLAAMGDIELIGDDKANFLLFRTSACNTLMGWLVERGILIRDQSGQLNLRNCLRVSLGCEQQNSHLCQTIEQFYLQQEQSE